jgi:sodium/bile acid cotransporter 7
VLACWVCTLLELPIKPPRPQAIRGNVAVAILLTVASNMLGVLTMPLLLPRLLGGGLPPGALEPGALLAQLAACVLAPTLAGAALRGGVPGAGWGGGVV